jgi:hypothetical protein
MSGTAEPTREGPERLAFPLGCFHFLDKHGQHHGPEGRNTHYLTSSKVCMPDSIYLGAGTHLITDHNNKLDQGYTHAFHNAPHVG